VILAAAGIGPSTVRNHLHANQLSHLRRFKVSEQIRSATVTKQVYLARRSDHYWRVTIDHPPLNIFGPDTIPQLNEIITALETDKHVKVSSLTGPLRPARSRCGTRRQRDGPREQREEVAQPRQVLLEVRRQLEQQRPSFAPSACARRRNSATWVSHSFSRNSW